VENSKEWEEIYRERAPDRLPWERGVPDPNLVNLIEKGTIAKGRVLDICSGLGTQTIYLAKKGFEVYGIDISPTAVKMAKKKCGAEGVTCKLLTADATNLQFPDELFVFVLDRGCFHSIPKEKREAFILGVHRILQKGGKYYMMCFSYRNRWAPNRFTKKDIQEYFSKLFKILEIKEITIKDSFGEEHSFYINLMEKK